MRSPLAVTGINPVSPEVVDVMVLNCSGNDAKAVPSAGICSRGSLKALSVEISMSTGVN